MIQELHFQCQHDSKEEEAALIQNQIISDIGVEITAAAAADGVEVAADRVAEVEVLADRVAEVVRVALV